jgi:hypothetical protein
MVTPRSMSRVLLKRRAMFFSWYSLFPVAPPPGIAALTPSSVLLAGQRRDYACHGVNALTSIMNAIII